MHGYFKEDLYSEIVHKLTLMYVPGMSRFEDKTGGNAAKIIRSANTFKYYKREGYRFADYVRLNSPYGRHTSLADAKQYAAAYCNGMDKKKNGQDYSAYTLNLRASALVKLFGCSREELGIATPERKIGNIKKGRAAETVIGKSGKSIKNRRTSFGNFSEDLNREIVAFCLSTGLRRSELERVRGTQLRFSNIDTYIPYDQAVIDFCGTMPKTQKDLKILKPKGFSIIVKGKGGRVRYARIIGDVEAIVDSMKYADGEKLWKAIPEHMDVHRYRRQYARTLYQILARDVSRIVEAKDAAIIKHLRGEANKAKRRCKLAEYYQEETLHFLEANNENNGVPQNQLYRCRTSVEGDGRRGMNFDKCAMAVVSESLGHSRLDVIADHYLF